MVNPLFFLGLCLLFFGFVSGSQEPLIYQGVGSIDRAERLQESLIVTTTSPVSAISLDYSSGNVQWRLDLRRSGSVQAMVVSEKIALFLLKEDVTHQNYFVFAVNPTTGSLLWEIEVQSSDSENVSLAYSKASSRVVLGNHLSLHMIENVLSSNPLLQKVNLPSLSCAKFVVAAEDITANQIQVGSCFAAKAVSDVMYDTEKKTTTVKSENNLPFLVAQFSEQSGILEIIKDKKVVFSKEIEPVGEVLSSESFLVSADGAHLPLLHVTTTLKNCIFSGPATGNHHEIIQDCILNYPNGPKLFLGKKFWPNNQVSKVSVYHVNANQQKPEFKITLKKQVANYPHYEVLIPASIYSLVSNVVDVSKGSSIELLVVLNNGISALVALKDGKSRVEWLRNDGLSRLKQSMIVSTSSNSTYEEDSEGSFFSAFDLKNLINIGEFVHSSSEKSSCRMHQHLLAFSHTMPMRQLASTSGFLIHLLELKPTLCGKAHIISWRPNFPADVLLDLDSAQLIPHYESSIKGKSVNGFTLVIHSKDAQQTYSWRVSLPVSSSSHFSWSSRYFKNDFYELSVSTAFDGSKNYVTSIPSNSDSILHVHESEENFQVLASPSSFDSLSASYFHTVNVDTGSISIHKIGKRKCEAHSTRTCRDADHVSTIQFDSQTEKISLVLHPSSQTGSSSRTTILGDDNVLLNYINPNLMVVCTLSQSSEASEESKLYVNLVDVISGKLLHRIVHDNAVGPIRGVIVDNFVLVAFWNNKAKRSEISSIGLYDGFIGKNDFTPFSYESKSKSDEALTFYKAQNVTHRSSFFTVAPLIMQRTYSLTRGISDITRTISAKGINNKNILLVLDSGQIYSLDFRVLSPRRPVSDPTQSEKEEGLVKYGPHIPLFPTAAVTKSKALAFDGSIKILSSAAHLESESFVVAHGEGGDLFIDIFTPAQAFDSLSRDFNFPALIGLLLLLSLCVFILRQLNRRTTLQRLWH